MWQIVVAGACCLALVGSAARGQPAAKVQALGAGASPSVCSAIVDRIDASEKEMSSLDTEGIGDNSAPRATLRASKLTAELTLVGIYMQQLQAQHCAAYPRPVSVSAYEAAAIECHTQMLRLESAMITDPKAKLELPPACDRSTWRRLK